jgi:amino acid transporter
MAPHAKQAHQKLGEFFSTAICGNDILSSALYVAGVATLFAGIYAPLVLLAVAAVLFFYRSVYREVVEALPMNGGAYNALLNATSKIIAATAGIMTILSYVATAAISGKTAVEYLFAWIKPVIAPLIGIAPAQIDTWVIPAVLLLLFGFAVLVASGVRDSAKVASVIFVFHIFTLIVFVAFGGLIILTKGGDIGHLNEIATQSLITQHGGLLKTLFLAFAASLLGVSGFESSANFVEEQKHGVFAKTLRNMTFAVAIFNPLIAAVILRVMPLANIIAGKDFLLADAARIMGGTVFLGWVAIDAFLVLAGAVMTSYIGASNLMRRMSLDACLPHFLLPKDPKSISTAKIIFTFFALCVSIIALTNGDLLSIAGVYTISFLSVMSLFAIGNLVLRATRPELQRPYHAPFPFVIIALISTLVGIMGNIAIDPRNTGYFLTYFIPAMIFIISVLYKKDVFETGKRIFSFIPAVKRFFQGKVDQLTEGHVYVFIHHLNRLSVILDYISRNEHARRVTLIHCKHHHAHFVTKTEDALETLKVAGFFKDFEFHVEYLDEPFSPAALDDYSKRKKIAKSNIFMGSIHHYHEFTYEDLGGVRIIF